MALIRSLVMNIEVNNGKDTIKYTPLSIVLIKGVTQGDENSGVFEYMSSLVNKMLGTADAAGIITPSGDRILPRVYHIMIGRGECAIYDAYSEEDDFKGQWIKAYILEKPIVFKCSYMGPYKSTVSDIPIRRECAVYLKDGKWFAVDDGKTLVITRRVISNENKLW